MASPIFLHISVHAHQDEMMIPGGVKHLLCWLLYHRSSTISPGQLVFLNPLKSTKIESLSRMKLQQHNFLSNQKSKIQPQKQEYSFEAFVKAQWTNTKSNNIIPWMDIWQKRFFTWKTGASFWAHPMPEKWLRVSTGLDISSLVTRQFYVN